LAELSRPDAFALTEHVIPQTSSAHARLQAGGALLEIGSGGGFHLVQYARTYPAARIVGVEVDPASVEIARGSLAEAALDGFVELRQADANALADVDMFDLVVMNITLHETGGPEHWANVLRRAHRALRIGGSVVVAELPYPDALEAYRGDPVYRMLAGVQLHEAVVGCGAITQGGLRTLLDSTGFTNVRVADQPLRTRHVMIGDRA
jgi:SAM-dependent methyltransferase